MIVQPSRRFPIHPTLEAFFLLEENGSDVVLRGSYVFKMTNVVFARRRLGSASSNDILSSTGSFKGILIANIFPFFQDQKTRIDDLQYFIDLPSAIFACHMPRRIGLRALNVGIFLRVLQSFNPGKSDFYQLV